MAGQNPADFFGNPLGFLDFTLELQDARRTATGPSCFQDLRMPSLVEGNQPVGGFGDRLSAAVIGFQFDDFGISPIPREVEDVLHFRAPPTINRLVIISHNTQIAVLKH